MSVTASALEQDLLVHLEAAQDGLAEHLLLKRLQAAHPDDFPDALFGDELALFRAHFLLFHALYRLRERLLAERHAVLEIDARCIKLVPWTSSVGTALADHDPLRDYYLDLTNLTGTTADDVAQMLGEFWGRYYAASRRSEALSVLGLAPSADLATAQQRYRELAMTHHPDRGGDVARFQALQEAMAILRRC